MLARKTTGHRVDNQLSHNFDDPALQREFDALLSNDDRQDYIDLIEGVKAVQNHGVISLDELKATHGDVQPV